MTYLEGMTPFLLLIVVHSLGAGYAAQATPTSHLLCVLLLAWCPATAALPTAPPGLQHVLAPQECSGIQKHVPMLLVWQPIVSFAEHRCKPLVCITADIWASHEVVQNRLRTAQQQSICMLYKDMLEGHVKSSRI